MKTFMLLLSITVSTSFFAFAEDSVDAATTRILPKAIEWRRYIHEHPELSNRETKTAKYIVEQLKPLGLEIKEGIAKTGVVAILKGGLPGPVIGLRADMDALPIIERTKVGFASKVKSTYNGQEVGVMHACGHDTHVAMLLGTATVLAGVKDKIRGTVVFIFQPAEEGAPQGEEGGAMLMVKEGVMTNPKIDAIFGIHISSNIEIGQIGFKSGAAMASSDILTIKIKGRGSHGASPWFGIDPIVVGSQIILGLQTIVSRQVDLTKSPAIITVGKINAGVRSNIIPEELTMTGTIRALDAELRKQLHQRITQTAQKIAESTGATAEVSIEIGNPVVFNNPDLVKKTLPSLIKAVGADNVLERPWITGAEDFAFYGLHTPAFFFWVGGMPKGSDPEKVPAHHTPDFFIDDSRLDVGIKAFTNIVLDYR